MYTNGLTAYLGDENSYSHAAATLLAGGSRLKGYDSMSAVIGAAVGGECDRAVLPVENNVEGAVNEVYDMMFDSGLYIAAQAVLPIRHSLICAEGAEISDVKTVRSHPQAIAQCRKFLSSLGSVTVEAVSSTSEALKTVSKTVAAIAYRPRSGQTVLKSAIQDSALNATRFSLFEKTRNDVGGTVSIAFDLKNEPGALVAALEVIRRAGVNMTRILSRPHRSGSGEYRFFIDFDFSAGNAELEVLLDGISAHCSAFRFLGRYDVAHA